MTKKIKIKMTKSQIKICDKFTNKYIKFYVEGTDYNQHNKQKGLDFIFSEADHEMGYELGAENAPEGVKYSYSKKGVAQRKPFVIAHYLVGTYMHDGYGFDEITEEQAKFDFDIMLEILDAIK